MACKIGKLFHFPPRPFVELLLFYPTRQAVKHILLIAFASRCSCELFIWNFESIRADASFFVPSVVRTVFYDCSFLMYVVVVV